MKKLDIIIIAIISVIGIATLLVFQLIESSSATGNVYAKITYENELILMIDLETLEYQVYDTIYRDQIDTGLASDGIFYVPGKVTTDMQALYEIDAYAREQEIVGIKVMIEDGQISVEYQESPKDLCELQPPTSSHLRPIVCLPNELVIDVYTNLSTEQFVPDSVLE